VQPTHAGWYWDPYGRPGLFRWWDGVQWTRHVTPDRNDPAPEPFHPQAPDRDGMLNTELLSFPALSEPWRQCPAYPGFAAAIGQERAVGRTPRGEYDALIVIGSTPERFAGLDPPDIARALNDEVLRTFYPHEKPGEPAQVAEIEVDGRPGVRLDVRLEVQDPALDFQREDLLLTVVGGAERAGLLYASLPAVEGLPSPNDVVSQLRVRSDNG
jgi:hypothetical protein